ncbi:hypothetical protein LguiA_022885 [Lonicera macranthoides]
MFIRQSTLRTGNLRPENLGQNALIIVFLLGVLIFTIISSTYKPDDPPFNPSKITSFLASTSSATFKFDSTVVKTGEDFMSPNQTVFPNFVNLVDTDSAESENECDPNDKVIDCRDPEVFHTMIKDAIERFKDIHFYRFAKAVRGSNDSSCHMAWRFAPKNGNPNAFYKDYRDIVIAKSDNCTYNVIGVGDYHSGLNVRKISKQKKPGVGTIPLNEEHQRIPLPVDGETVNDSLPVVESERDFIRGKYLVYTGGGDRCKTMDQYLWSFMCSLGEARYLKRTLVMDMSICLSSIYTSSGQDEEGKDFRFYFDFEHLKKSTSVLDQQQFWLEWDKWHQRDGLRLHLVEDFRVTPMKLKKVKDTLIMRKFGFVEPDNYWYRVCEGETETVVQRPWHLIWKSRRLMDIVLSIVAKLNFDFDSVHVVRGEKARNKELWPNVDVDTSPKSIISKLKDKIEKGRNLYIATDEVDTSLFDPLREKYSIHFLDEYKEFWDDNSEWYIQTMRLNQKVAVEFDAYMKASIDTEVFLRGKRQIETFNDLTKDCKDGINTCTLTG